MWNEGYELRCVDCVPNWWVAGMVLGVLLGVLLLIMFAQVCDATNRSYEYQSRPVNYNPSDDPLIKHFEDLQKQFPNTFKQGNPPKAEPAPKEENPKSRAPTL